MNICVLRISVVIFIIFPSWAFGCCSSPLAETVFIGSVVDVKSVGKDGDVIYHVDIEKTASVFGNAPDKYVIKIHEVTLANVYKAKMDLGASYLITLYDAGKHDSKDQFLSNDKWGESKLMAHPLIGFLPSNGFKAMMVKKHTSYYGSLEWTKDFKLMNIYFLQ